MHYFLKILKKIGVVCSVKSTIRYRFSLNCTCNLHLKYNQAKRNVHLARHHNVHLMALSVKMQPTSLAYYMDSVHIAFLVACFVRENKLTQLDTFGKVFVLVHIFKVKYFNVR